MLVELEPNRLGIAIDSELRTRDVTALLHLLFTLRRKVEQLFIDSPIIELLVAQVLLCYSDARHNGLRVFVFKHS